MVEFLKAAVQRGASDLHIKTGDVIRARVNGELIPMTQQRLTPEQVQQIALQILPRERDRERIDELCDFDCSWGVPGVGRFRVNLLRQRGSLMIVLRMIPFDVPSIEELRLPGVLAKVVEAERGLILVTGATGSGKSTTIAAMIREINRTRRKHIITLENPIEFLHRDQQCSVTQREIGTDTDSFQIGLRAALREDPDVILVGEMRDAETIDTAVKAAETGHLVLSTLHTQNAIQTISRVVAVFPPHEQEIVRMRLSETLVAVVGQRLLPRANATGRIPAVEVMVATSTIRDSIRDPSKTDDIFELMEEGREQYGSQTFDQHLIELVSAGDVSFEVAKMAASRPADFELKVKTFA